MQMEAGDALAIGLKGKDIFTADVAGKQKTERVFKASTDSVRNGEVVKVYVREE